MATTLSRRRAAFSSLVLMAVLLRAFVPQGFMPQMRADAGGAPSFFQMEICTSAGYATLAVPVDEDGGDSHRDNGEAAPPCVFAAVFAQGFTAPFFIFLRNLAPQSVPGVPAGGAVRETAQAPYQSRGPPASF